jgi:hypothetical protein
MADQNDGIVRRPIRHQTSARIIMRELRMAFIRAVLGAVVDLGSLDSCEDFTGATMEGADRAAFRLMGRKAGPELLQGVAPIGNAAEFTRPPAE